MSAMRHHRRYFLHGVAALPLLALAACGRKPVLGTRVPAGATVLALGDSLTFGTGATPETSYPTVLARLSGWNVVNAGVPGDLSGQALERLPPLMAEHRPALVLLSIGGNDLLRRLPDAQTRDNIRSIVRQSREGGAQVMLIAVPAPSVAAAATGSLADHAMYEEIAQSEKLPLHARGWSTVLGDAALRSDQIHANARGYEQFAQGLLQSLRAAQIA